MAKTGRPSRPAPPAASSTSSPAPTPGCRRDYALLGKVTKGIDAVERIGQLGDPARADAARALAHAGSWSMKGGPPEPVSAVFDVGEADFRSG